MNDQMSAVDEGLNFESAEVDSIELRSLNTREGVIHSRNFDSQHSNVMAFRDHATSSLLSLEVENRLPYAVESPHYRHPNSWNIDSEQMPPICPR